jgi:hypothetical protein
MATLKRRLDALEAEHGTTHKSAAEMTDAELMRIAGVGPDVTNEELERIARGCAEQHSET